MGKRGIYKVYDMIVATQRELAKARNDLSYSDLQELRTLLMRARALAGKYKL